MRAHAKRCILIVDMDQTLLRTDMLFECLCSAIGRDWRNLFFALFAWRGGRAHLKRYLAGATNIDFARMPYNSQVIHFIENWRKAGGRTALVSGSDVALAQAAADHVGLFDEVHGSDGRSNLKGENKAQFLQDQFGADGFAYMGDAWADIEVWKRADRAITVNAGPALRRRAEQVCDATCHLESERPGISAYAKVLRPYQWVKNTLVFLPILSSHQFDQTHLLLALLGFFCFCLVASGSYALNDLLDIEADRVHQHKRHRAFASGSIPLSHGLSMSFGLIASGIGWAAVISFEFFFFLSLYLMLATAYSLILKRKAIVDIFALSLLYGIRILAGSAVTDITISHWLLAFSGFLFLSLAAIKRQVELLGNSRLGASTSPGRGYNVGDLPIVSMIAVATGYASILVLMLYTGSSSVTLLYSHPQALWGACAVLFFWITNTVFAAHRGEMHHDPIIYAFADRTSQVCLVTFVLFVIAASTDLKGIATP